jgi:transposase
VLFVGDDWAEDHHDVEVQDETGRRLGRARLPEGVAGVARLHALIGEHLGEDAEPDEVAIGIETDPGPWVQALIAAGYTVYAINPRQVARYRERHGSFGCQKRRRGCARAGRYGAHRQPSAACGRGGQPAGSGGQGGGAGASEADLGRHRHTLRLRLRTALREFFPAALEAFGELTGPDVLELLAKAPDPVSAARLSRAQIAGALKRARRRKVEDKTTAIQAALRTEHLTQPPAVAAAYAATVRSLVSVISTFNAEITTMEEQVQACFGRARDAEVYLSQPGLGRILAARVLGEFGDDPDRYATAKNRKNYAGTSPITRQSGKKKTVLARFIHNDRLVDALHQQAFCALNASPGARACYDELRGRGTGHNAALRQLSNRLVGILHGCLKTSTTYDEHTAWAHHNQDQQTAA